MIKVLPTPKICQEIDGGVWEIDGKKLAEKGFCLHIEEKRVAKLYIYEKIED